MSKIIEKICVILFGIVIGILLYFYRKHKESNKNE